MQLHNRSERHRELFVAGMGVFLLFGFGLTAPPARQDAGQGKTPTTNAQAAARQADQAALPETERVYYDVPDEEGRLSGGFVVIPRPDIRNVEKSLTSTYTTILNNGPSSNRIDIVFVGPYDLSQSLGVPGQVEHPLVIEKMKEIVEVCLGKNILVGNFTETVSQTKMWIGQGLRYMSYSVDVGILFEAGRTLLGDLKGMRE